MRFSRLFSTFCDKSREVLASQQKKERVYFVQLSFFCNFVRNLKLSLFIGSLRDKAFLRVTNWMRNRNTVEFLGIWETLHNPNFNPLEFEGFRKEAGLNAFTLSPTRWIEATNAIGIVSQAGRYGGTFAQTDIAFEFASWISVEFRLYLVMEFQRLKAKEQELLGWTAKRELSKINYRIHTDAIKSHLIPEEITTTQASIIYAEEADVLNVAMFGMTAKQWREAIPI